MPRLVNSAFCSKDAPSRWEGKNWPDIHGLRLYEEKFSTRRTSPKWRISKSEEAGHASGRQWNQRIVEGKSDHTLPRSHSDAELLGPGQYRVHRHFPENKEEEWRQWIPTDFTFEKDSRYAPDGALRGNSTSAGNKKTNPLGPGQYPVTESGATKHAPVRYSFPRGKESAEEVRLRKASGTAPAPGTYEAYSPLTEAGRVRWEASQKLPQKLNRMDLHMEPDAFESETHRLAGLPEV
eukprot:CAMPEP_0180476670 /NCGR_PEP_ID=MMETSP1036_2-20121128/31859_1 /TAXON_ID=632150 /ORGANISM="Azadinium spinosum, Strain 3D9" /LENGTH=236 /DNA_ID=CAMNT_0022484119 /DNA_START=73 /DNA_END=780 /DNA_ORIENTATION=+